MPKFAVGVDFGTLSARALVAEIGTGRELGAATMDYPHAVMTRALPNGTPLKPDWALQHPRDYLDCLGFVVPEALRRSGVDPADVVGMGIDCTASTSLPVDADGTPLCFHHRFSSMPHAWPMLWKHHAAQPYATRMQQAAESRGESFLARYGGKVSSEWLMPKLWQILDEAPEVYAAADRFIEAGDWIVYKLTGVERRSAAIAGYKAFWHKEDGYPSEEFFGALDPRLARVVDEKLSRALYPAGTRAGGLDAFGAKLTGLPVGMPVAVANIDAHVSLPPAGVVEPGRLLMILGTSTCHIVLGAEERAVPGICGVVEDGVVPGLYGYEAGQSCCGDHFKWLIENFVPGSDAAEAAARGIGLHELLTERASALRPGESGLIALDWWNGNRSVLVDMDLTGLMVGMTLATRPEEVYRALIEATAYGTRAIVENFASHGVRVDSLCACGGIAKKNPLMMQIYADVLGREIHIARSAQTPALGSAMYGAVAAGRAGGGYDTIAEASRAMGGVEDAAYAPDAEASRVYDALYAEYIRLHDLFGRGGCDVMKRLKRIRERAIR